MSLSRVYSVYCIFIFFRNANQFPWPSPSVYSIGLGRYSWPRLIGPRLFTRTKVEHSHSPSQEFCFKLERHKLISMCRTRNQNQEGIFLLWTPSERCRAVVFFHTNQRSKESLFSEKEKKQEVKTRNEKGFLQTLTDNLPVWVQPFWQAGCILLDPKGIPERWLQFYSFRLSKVNWFKQARGSSNGQLLLFVITSISVLHTLIRETFS